MSSGHERTVQHSTSPEGKEARMPYLLNVVYLLLIVLCSPISPTPRSATGSIGTGGAKNSWARAPRRTGQRPCIWLHAVSVGEVNLLQPS